LALEAASIDPIDLRDLLRQNAIEDGTAPRPEYSLSLDARHCLNRAFLSAGRAGRSSIDSLDLLEGLLTDPSIAALMNARRLDAKQLLELLTAGRTDRASP
jgi:hypothetical protein